MSTAATPARVLAAACTLLVVSLVAFAVGGELVGALTATALNVLVVITVLARLVRAEGRSRLPYALLLVGFAALIGVNWLWLATAAWGEGHAAPAGVHDALLGMAYLFLLGAALLAIAPTIRRDPGSVLDASTLAVALASAAWGAEVAPALHAASAPTGDRAYAFLITMALSATTGIIVGVRFNRAVPRAGRASLVYFAIAVLVAVLANGLSSALVDPFTGVAPVWVDALWPITYVAAWAAVAHPAGPEAFQVGPLHVSRLSGRRLALLGGALIATPLIAVVRDLTGSYVEWLTGTLAHLVVVVLVLARVSQLASDHRDAEARLRVLADEDGLTGLPNRRAVDHHLEAAVARVEAGRAPGLVVSFIDLDGFKQINDTRGHAVGDELLVAVARRLARISRSRDGDMVGRLSGDEFIMIAVCDPAVASHGIDARIRGAFTEGFALTDGTVSIHASIGLATAQAGERCTVDSLLTQADHQMYADKRSKRSPVET
ncbi:GGDEF domain-containing protein [Demequina capsici]|uniref:GGDEF domain-containing protein n=1 Tax=Demequina capsici TaxID=3075620 RepID=A0AA96F9P9_9MICO|nr:GGDEF domain-containing protein [Demequina sp. OYTSA14]WNM25315.1 GGDEF domain-containing protein [Demequina sp. OYTSA14]